MNRTHLERAADVLASSLGYIFFASPDECLPRAVTAYPAAVLAPLALCSVEGHSHGRAIYDMTLRLLRTGARLSPEDQCKAYAALEDDLVAIFNGLAGNEKVIAVEKLAIRPAAFTLTPHGEISQTATARIVTCF